MLASTPSRKFATHLAVQLAPRQLELFRPLKSAEYGSLQQGDHPAQPEHVEGLSTPLEVSGGGHQLLGTCNEVQTTPRPVALVPVMEGVVRPTRQEVLSRAHQLARRVAQALGSEFKVLLKVHDNRSTMISFRRQPLVLKVRVHHMFLDAPDHVVVALAEYAAKSDTAAGRALDDFIAARQEAIRALPRTASALDGRGRCFDLQNVFDELNAQYFQGGIAARIGWGRQTGKRRRRSIRLGVYDHKSREIRIHPSLDHPDVPRFFVEYIVFHEMLHQVFPSQRHTGRHVHHSRAFRAREGEFPRYSAAIAWEKENLAVLLRR